MTYARMGWAFLLTALLCVPSFALAGQKIDLRQSDGTITELGGDGSAANVKCVSGCGGVGGGDASLAEQQTQSGLLTTIDGDTGTISTNSSTLAGAVKAEDAAHTTGDTGVMALCVRAASPPSVCSTSPSAPFITSNQAEISSLAWMNPRFFSKRHCLYCPHLVHRGSMLLHVEVAGQPDRVPW